MTDYVDVNGALIEREYFEANVAEARACDWQIDRFSTPGDHTHCIVCGRTITDETAYRSDSRWLCGFCYSKFVAVSA